MGGLNLDWNKDYHKVLLEVDSNNVVKLLKEDENSTCITHNLLVQKCINILRRWKMCIKHIFREQNSMAGLLAKNALLHGWNFRNLVVPPSFLNEPTWGDGVGQVNP